MKATPLAITNLAAASVVGLVSIAGVAVGACAQGAPSFGDEGRSPDAAADSASFGADVGTFGDGGGASCRRSTLSSQVAGADGATSSVVDYEFEPEKGDRGDGYTTYSAFRVLRSFSHTDALDVRWSYTSTGKRDRVTQMAPGPDGQSGTLDDTTVSMNVYELDGDGLLAKNLFRKDPGPDGVWGNQDDPVVNGWRFVHGADGYLRFAIPADATGPDGLWGTADDHATSSYRFTHDRGHFGAQEICDQAGADGVFGTADDVVRFRIVFPCRGDDVVYEGYSAPGADGLWGTADDVLSSRVVESGDRCMRAACGILIP